ncbi:MAG: hypothetical protein K2J68_10335 [Treponemataceae bacterium]|nr:hypothetical protein [Treponemataceae bacterium]
MIKIKPVVICASIALALSFFVSLLSRNSLPISLLKAVIFAAVFGGIAVGIQVVYDKFLSEGEASSITESRAPQQKTVGSKVDLVVSEEDLPNEENAPTFALDSTRHVLTAADVGVKTSSARENVVEQNMRPAQPSVGVSDETKIAEPSGNESVPAGNVSEESGTFVRQDLAAKPEAVNASTSSSEDSARPESSKSDDAKSSSVGGDELPELDDFPALGGDDSEDKQSSEDEGVIEDSDFAEGGSPSIPRRTEFSDGTIADSKDASLMAEAIRTVLVKDE